MTDPIPFQVARDTRRLKDQHDTTPEQLRALVRELFLWMHDKGIDSVTINRTGTKANVIIDGKPL